MPRPPELRAREYCLLVLGIALLALVSPLRILWARDDSHWLVPFAIWLVILVLAGFAARQRDQP